MYYVYLLLLKDKKIYTGRCNDLKRRFYEHNQRKVESTKNHLPAKLIYYEAYLSKKDTVDRESYLKTGDGRKEIRKQIKSFLEKYNIK
ncbi:MAG: GIY-YIG nuclease family protein [Patescibacteria group bacterium]